MTTTTAPTIGDIAYSSWGYEQTNITFYRVTRTTTTSVWLEEIPSIRTETGWATGTATPDTAAAGTPIGRRKIQTCWRGEWAASINTWEFARAWDGEPQRWTSYH